MSIRQEFPGFQAHIHRFASEASDLIHTVGNHVPDDHEPALSRWQAVAQASPTGPALNVNRAPRSDTGADGAMTTRGGKCRRAGPIPGPFPSPAAGPKREQAEIGMRHHNVLGLSSHPSAHVDVPVCSSRPGFAGIQADAGLPARELRLPCSQPFTFVNNNVVLWPGLTNRQERKHLPR